MENSFRVDREGCPICNKTIGQPETVYELMTHQKSNVPWPMCRVCVGKWSTFCNICKMPVSESPVLSAGTTAAKLMYECTWCHKFKE